MGRFSEVIAGMRYNLHKPDFLFRREKTRRALRESWGRAADIDRDFGLIAAYHELSPDSGRRGAVDDKTWRDLNLDEILCRLDRTISAVGRQHLYRTLRRCAATQDEVQTRNEQYKLFREDAGLREDIQLILGHLKAPNASYIVHLILGEIPAKPKIHLLIYLSSLLTVCATVLMFFMPQIFYVPLLLAVVNIVIHAVYSNKLYQFFPGLSYLNTLLGVAISLVKIDDRQMLPQLQSLRTRLETIKKMRKAVGWMVIDRSRLGDLLDTAVEYLNLFCLFDLVAFIRSLDSLKKYRAELAEIFEEVSSLDSAISTASYLESLQHYCRPELTSSGDIELDDAYHSLLDNPVANSFASAGHSALITGSNMAGKTTFIKTVGVNVILARSLGICLARRAVIPELTVRSSMRREDALSDGQSYYFAEVAALKEFIARCSDNSHYLFLIDEIYRGTNTIERISSATAVLNFLGARNLVLVTTHDIELQDLLDEHYRMYHFSEQVEGERFFFDYKLKHGPTKSRNAIKLLEISGYPQEITTRASELARELSEKYKDE